MAKVEPKVTPKEVTDPVAETVSGVDTITMGDAKLLEEKVNIPPKGECEVTVVEGVTHIVMA